MSWSEKNFRRLQAAQEGFEEKGGPGSGRRGHTSGGSGGGSEATGAQKANAKYIQPKAGDTPTQAVDRASTDLTVNNRAPKKGESTRDHVARHLGESHPLVKGHDASGGKADNAKAAHADSQAEAYGSMAQKARADGEHARADSLEKSGEGFRNDAKRHRSGK